MAKLGSFYSLCPLIDNKHLLDVSDDPEEGIVIVTLGKNLASRYKISDQKQITCWRTKEKFSSPVLYHKGKCKYVAVFNQSYVKFWETDDSLDKLKKYKFNKPIHTLIKKNENFFIIFQNGCIYNLDEVLEDRKTLNPEGLNIKQIDHVLCEQLEHQFYFGFVSENTLYWTKFEQNKCKFSKIPLERNDGISINGFVFHIIRNDLYLLTLWSDGSMYSRSLADPNLEEDSVGALFTVVDSVSSKNFISMKSLDENYIALYGASSNEEGAILTLYNIQFKVTQSKQPFKLFTANSKIWGIENNLLIPVGQNLAVVPFRLETEQLAALVGSHKDIYTDIDPDIKIIQELEVASWGKKSGNVRDLPKSLKNKVDQFVNQGLSESTILEELLPEIFDKNDTDLLILMLNHFSDIPEKYLVQMINYSLITDHSKLLNNVLKRPFSDVLILPHLRSVLPLDYVSELLKFLHELWWKNKTLPGLSYIETHSKLLEWSCAVIDSNYQKIVLSKDEILVETLSKLNQLVQKYLTSLESLQAVVPLLSSVKRNKTVDRYFDVGNLRYSIEQISLY